MPFEIIPAIDIRGGLCVRLFQGDYSQETVFSDDPVSVARRWEECGAPRIHVVDLDGAAAGRPVNTTVIRAIASAVSIPIEVGGGIRNLAAMDELLTLGVQRFVLGTAAVEDPALVAEAAKRYGDRLIVGVDARNGLVATRGWKDTQGIRALDLVARMESLGVVRFDYTDIARDGAMAGPNLPAIGEVVAAARGKVIAAGGVSSLDDLRRLAGIGVEGAIVGRAAYTGAVDIRLGVQAAKTEGW